MADSEPWPYDAPIPDVPAGWEPTPNPSGFGRKIGPVFRPRDGSGPVRRAFRAADHHCNGAGIVHGGMLLSFADVLLGTAAWHLSGPALTVRLVGDFLEAVKPGAWVEGTAELLAENDRLLHLTARITANGRPAFAATGVFRRMQWPRQKADDER